MERNRGDTTTTYAADTQHICQSIFHAAKMNHMKCVESLCEEHMQQRSSNVDAAHLNSLLNAQQVETKKTPLMYAAEYGCLDVLIQLIEKGIACFHLFPFIACITKNAHTRFHEHGSYTKCA